MKKTLFFCMIGACLLLGVAVKGLTIKGRPVKQLQITSPSFKHEQAIPAEFTCEGNDALPELIVSGIPTNAKSLTIIVDDPDAPDGTWVHWIAFNIPSSMNRFPKNVNKSGVLEHAGAVQATNSWGKTLWGGPCPPTGNHRYYFKIYALDSLLSLTEQATKKQVEDAMDGHIVAQGELMGTYQKTK